MHRILTLNSISPAGLARLPRETYEIGPDVRHPDAILLRSFNMHDLPIADSLKAVGRAGAGVNNIPIERMSARGIPVFNAPGANANAVKELVVAGMLLACRNLCEAWDFTRQLDGSDAEIARQVEDGKKRFAGFELPGRTLGVIGLGAVGRSVANASVALGMNVVGFDPGITVEGAWQLSSAVEQAASFDALLGRADIVTFHVPLVDATRKMLSAERVGRMKRDAVILNFSRSGIVDDEAVLEAIRASRIRAYVTDFPSSLLRNHDRVITLPHLGASTKEAEDNCAVMVADEVRDFLERGNVANSVNFPTALLDRGEGYRVTVVNSNVPNMVGQISSAMARRGLNILDMLNKSRGELAYTIIDVDQPVAEDLVQEIGAIDGVRAVRALEP